MQIERKSSFGDRDVTMRKLVLSDANLIIIPVMNSITKFAMGETGVFDHFSVIDIQNLQKLLCKYVSFSDTSSNLTLIDISENIQDFLGISFEFLEFAFGFFSQSRKILARINGQLSETAETKNPSV